jgi:hypothetical protein
VTLNDRQARFKTPIASSSSTTITFINGIYNYKPETICFQITQQCSYPVVTLYGACNVTSHGKPVVLLSQYFPEYVRCKRLQN